MLWISIFQRRIRPHFKSCVHSNIDGLGIESRWRSDFPHLFRPALGPTQPPLQWVLGLSRGVKSSRGVTLTPHSLLVPLSRKSRAIPQLLLWAVRPVQSLSACTGCTFLPYTATQITFYSPVICKEIQDQIKSKLIYATQNIDRLMIYDDTIQFCFILYK